MKTIVAKCCAQKYEYELDPNVFDNVEDFIFREACIRAVEERSKMTSFNMSPIIECYAKEDENDVTKHILFNTYFILIGARMYDKAKLLREKFQIQLNVDLQGEPLRHPK